MIPVAATIARRNPIAKTLARTIPVAVTFARWSPIAKTLATKILVSATIAVGIPPPRRPSGRSRCLRDRHVDPIAMTIAKMIPVAEAITR